MPTKRKKKDTEVERLEKENKELKALNRTLLRRIKKLDKFYTPEYDEEEQLVEHNKKHNKRSCEKCDSGTLDKIDLGVRIIWKCQNCGHSKTEKV